MATITLTSPGASVDRSNTISLNWSWTRASTSEYLQAWRLRYRLVGAGTWSYAYIASQPGGAFLTNPSAETDLTNWTGGGYGSESYNSALLRTAGGRRDSWAVERQVSAVDPYSVGDRIHRIYNGKQSDGSLQLSVTAGQRYVFGGWVQNDGSSASPKAAAIVLWYDAAGNFVSPTYTWPMSLFASGWTPVAAEVVAPPGAVKAWPSIEVSSGNNVGNKARVDDYDWWRVSSSSSWVTADATGTRWTHKYAGEPTGAASTAPPAPLAVLPPNFLAAGNYELSIEAITGGTGVAAATYTSNTVTVTFATQPAAPTITVPAADGAVIPASPTNATMTYTAGPNQVQWRVLDPSTGAVLYDSGVLTVANTTTSHTHAVPYPTNGVSRTVQARTGNSGVMSAWATRSVTVTYTPPATPTLTAVGEDTFSEGFPHAVRVTVTNPTPTGSQPTVTTYAVEWRQVGTTAWKPAGSQVAGQPFVWYAAPSVPMQMQVTAYAANGTSTTSSAVTVTPAVALKGVVIYDPTNPAGIANFRLNDDGAEDEEQVESALLTFSGRQYPVLEFGAGAQRQISVPLLSLRTDADLATLKAFVRARTPVVYRDRRGRAVLAQMKVERVRDAFYGYTTALTFDVLDSWGV